MKNLSGPFTFLFLFFGFVAFAQLPDGSIAPDFEVDIMSKNDPTFPPTGSFSLYEETSQDRGVCLFFMTSWCSPCWTFNEDKVLDTIFNMYGPLGTNDANVLMIETDERTNRECLFDSTGCSYRTPRGDWTLVPYTITDLDSMNSPGLDTIYEVEIYPLLYVVSPDNRIYRINDRTVEEYESWLLESFKLTASGDIIDAVCGDDGAIVLLVTGGAGTLQYQWSNGANTKDLAAIGAGSYSVTITDENGYDKELGPFIVNGPTDTLGIDSARITNVSCFGAMDGSIALEVTGGTAPFNYMWSTGANTDSIGALDQGSFEVTITDANACRDSSIFTITEPSELILNYLTSPERCDLQNGVIEVAAGGGAPPYEFSIGGAFTTQTIFRNLDAGVYTLTVRDSSGCEQGEQALVDSIPSPFANAGMDQVLDCGADSLILNGSLSASGPDITYLWTTRDGNIRSGDTTLMPVVDRVGSYVLFVTNNSTLCTSTDTVEVLQDQSVISNAGQDTSLSCAITEIMLDGTNSSQGPDLEYEWLTLNGNIVRGANTLTPTVDEPGTYTLYVTDVVRNCTDQDFVVVEDFTSLPLINIATPDTITCNNATITLNASGSSTGPNFQIEWSTQNGNILSGANSLFAQVDQPGNYTLTITNTLTSCVSERIVEVIEFINTPVADFSFRTDGLTVTFMDRSVGDPSSWSWDFGDGALSNLQNPVHQYDVANTFTVCLTIVNECDQDQKCINVTIGTGMGLRIAAASSKDVSCFGGSDGEIDVTVEGGVPPYSFNWSNGSMTEDITGLPAGQYGMTVTDQSNTSRSGIYFIDEPDSVSVTDIQIMDATGTMANGSINIEVEGGVSPYSYRWSNGASSEDISGLVPGSYSCTITDANDCEKVVGPFEVKMVNSAPQISGLEYLNIFPNPVGGRLFINASFSKVSERKMIISSLLGERLSAFDFHTDKIIMELDVSSMASGSYILQIIDESGFVSEKLLITQ